MNESCITDDLLLVTPEEAARRLSVGRTTIYELMASGALQSVTIGRCRRVPVSSLSSFVNRLIGDVDAVQPHSTGEGRTADAEGLVTIVGPVIRPPHTVTDQWR